MAGISSCLAHAFTHPVGHDPPYVLPKPLGDRVVRECPRYPYTLRRSHHVRDARAGAAGPVIRYDKSPIDFKHMTGL
jgi:hypothetical protein